MSGNPVIPPLVSRAIPGSIAPPVIHVFGDPIEIVVSSRTSNQTCCVGIQTCQPGGGPPPHKHEREEEIFTVLEGAFELFNGEVWLRVQPGVPVFSPRGQFHAFRNVGAGSGRMMFMTNNGGLDEYFAAISPLEMPRDAARLTEISAHYGIVFQGG